jgi:hypothetical protein
MSTSAVTITTKCPGVLNEVPTQLEDTMRAGKLPDLIVGLETDGQDHMERLLFPNAPNDFHSHPFQLSLGRRSCATENFCRRLQREAHGPEIKAEVLMSTMPCDGDGDDGLEPSGPGFSRLVWWVEFDRQQDHSAWWCLPIAVPGRPKRDDSIDKLWCVQMFFNDGVSTPVLLGVSSFRSGAERMAGLFAQFATCTVLAHTHPGTVLTTPNHYVSMRIIELDKACADAQSGMISPPVCSHAHDGDTRGCEVCGYHPVILGWWPGRYTQKALNRQSLSG